MNKRRFFGTDGIRGKVGGSLLTPDFVQKLGYAIGMVLSDGYSTCNINNILIVRDTRISGDMLQAALSAGICSAGVSVVDLGILPTPACAYLVQSFNALAGIVISASHNPYYDNGIKIFTKDGNKLTDEQEAKIEAVLNQSLITSQNHIGRIITDHSFYHNYISHCLSVLNNRTDFNVIIDCSNGAMYKVAPEVFTKLGIKVTVVNNEPNGININHECGAASKRGLENLSNLVKQNKADLGIAFDGDGDRVILVSSNGTIIDGDQILYILACEKIGSDLAFGVVGTQMSNLGLEQALLRKGFAFERTKVGDRYVLERLLEKNWILGGETSGHTLSLDRLAYCDGLIISLLIILVMSKSGKSIDELVAEFYKYPQVMINIDISSREQGDHDILSTDIVKSAIADLENSFIDGSSGNGRLLIRKSGTEPLIRVMVEGERLAQIEKTANELANVIMSQI